jgi:hypothetical protein
MTRRALLLVPIAACCHAADPAREVLDLLTDVAASLSAGNVSSFMSAFDSAMPGYAELRANVTGLIGQGDVRSIIDPLEDAGDDRLRTVELNWTLRIYRGSETLPSLSREQVVKCRVEKRGERGGKWRITSFEPAGFFAPA